MKNIIALCLVLSLLMLSSCEAIGNIFSAGVYTGLAVVVLVVIVVVWIVSRLNRRG